MTQHDNRDAITGRFVSDEVAQERPETTVRERVATPDEAHDIGYAKGHIDGYREGRAEGRVEALRDAADAMDRRLTTPDHVGQHIAAADWLRQRADEAAQDVTP